MTRSPRLFIVGLGDLGLHVLGLLLRRSARLEVVVGARDLELTQRRVRLQQLIALQHDRWHRVDVVPVDLSDVAATAETLARHEPDVVFTAASRQSWRIITALPRDVFDELDRAQFGPWLPMHLWPVHQLMKAVAASGLPRVKTVNAAFPDACHPVLATAGLAPTTGVGNVANIVPALRCAAAHALGASDPLETQVMLYAQHFFTHGVPRTGRSDGAPYRLRVMHRREDVTERLDAEELFGLVATRFKRQGGRPGQQLTAGSALRVLDALLEDGRRVLHAPGPGGLPGGWAVYVDRRGVTPLVPEGLSREELVEVNEGGQRLDGIERIDDDGTVHFAAPNMAIMKRMIGWDVACLHLDEMGEAAVELGKRYRAFARSQGIV